MIFLSREVLFYFTLFGKNITITTFGVLLGLGVLVLAGLFLTGIKRLKKDQKKQDLFLYYSLFVGVVTYIAAVGFDALWHSIDMGVKFSFSNGGMTFEGGVLTGILVYMILFNFIFKEEKGHVLCYTDILVCGILIAHVFGRIGCFHAGCCYGKTADELPKFLQWLPVHYHTGNAPLSFQNVDRVPTQLIEASFLLIMFILFITVIKKHRTEIYLMSYGVYRFFAEYLRGDSRGESPFKALSPSQFFSILFVVVGILVLLYRMYMYKKDLKAYEALEDKSTYVKQIKSYDISYKNVIHGFFKPNKCEKCNKKLKLVAVSTTEDISEIEEKYHYHFTWHCYCDENNDYIEINK